MKKKLINLTPFLLVAVFYAGLAFAGTNGTEFQEVYDMIVNWTQGTLGKTIAVGTFLVGMGIGVARQSLMPIVLGIGSGLALYYTPNIVDNIVVAFM